MSAVAARIKEKLVQKGISAHALEKKAGLRASAVHNILYGRSKNPSVTIIQAIAQALECSVTDLIDQNVSDHEEVSQHQGQRNAFQDYCGNAEWSPELYLHCFTTVNHLLKKKRAELSKEKFFGVVEEVYLYSARDGNYEADKRFSEWIISKSIS
jgi:transcriptional regulator with XRE-family HTH domain